MVDLIIIKFVIDGHRNIEYRSVAIYPKRSWFMVINFIIHPNILVGFEYFLFWTLVFTIHISIFHIHIGNSISPYYHRP